MREKLLLVTWLKCKYNNQTISNFKAGFTTHQHKPLVKVRTNKELALYMNLGQFNKQRILEMKT